MAVTPTSSRSTPVSVPSVPDEPIWPLSVEQYHRMIAAGILTKDDRVELLRGWLVARLVKNPPHETSAELVFEALQRVVPAGWNVRQERPVTITSEASEPQPDLVVIKGDSRRYAHRHPYPQDIALVVEVADSSLERDRGFKQKLYAAARLPVYWIVNVIDRRIEVYTLPRDGVEPPGYERCQSFAETDEVPVLIENVEVGTLRVHDLLP